MSYVINGNSYSFNCKGRSNRFGFTHDCDLYINGVHYAHCHAQYYNMVNESYRFQSVMKGSIYQLIEIEEKKLEDKFKKIYGVKRFTFKREMEFEEYKNKNGATLKEYKEVYNKL